MIRLPLCWRRRTVAVLLRPAGSSRPAAEVARALVAGPFAVVRGSRYSLDSGDCFTLYHLPSQVPLFTLPQQRLCKQAAAELAGLALAWESADPLAVTGPDIGKASEVHRKWQALENCTGGGR